MLKSFTNKPVQIKLFKSFMIGHARNNIWSHSGTKIIWPLIWSVLSKSSSRSKKCQGEYNPSIFCLYMWKFWGYGNVGFQVSKRGIKFLKRSLAKNHHTRKKLVYFLNSVKCRNWCWMSNTCHCLTVVEFYNLGHIQGILRVH